MSTETTTSAIELEKAAIEGTTLKGYRNLNDVENFYRFVYENKVRKEAHLIFKEILKILAPKKKARKTRTTKAKKH